VLVEDEIGPGLETMARGLSNSISRGTPPTATKLSPPGREDGGLADVEAGREVLVTAEAQNEAVQIDPVTARLSARYTCSSRTGPAWPAGLERSTAGLLDASAFRCEDTGKKVLLGP